MRLDPAHLGHLLAQGCLDKLPQGHLGTGAPPARAAQLHMHHAVDHIYNLDCAAVRGHVGPHLFQRQFGLLDRRQGGQVVEQQQCLHGRIIQQLFVVQGRTRLQR